MRTIQMTLDEELIDRVDKVVKKLHTTRSAFTRSALRKAIEKINTNQLEEKHRKGYEKRPVELSEFIIWESEQKWCD